MKFELHSYVSIIIAVAISGVISWGFYQISTPENVFAAIRLIEKGRIFLTNPQPLPAPTPTALPIVYRYPPTAIRIAKINKELPVQAALVHDNQWDLFSNAVAWLSTSAVPTEGNVILYGHNWRSLLGDLYKLIPGDIIEIQQNNSWLKYSVTESRAISPKDVDAILSDQNQLTIYTCEGSFDQKRRLVYATPVD
jgi:LPXTG-site transpeptidase (sortase) family protein